MQTHDILQKSRLLREDKRLETLFALTCSYEDEAAAIELVDGREQVTTYADYRQMTMNYAAYLRKTIGQEKRGSFVGISMDTCKEWFPTFWGLTQAGYCVLLIDASRDDKMVR